ncbi:MAG: Gfo/Idh/MocA family oxidoreductase [Clostridiales bacterium]|nr:Gfo/Idh/MocA family oxidoreductase [Clostridiales bacterium]
MMKIGVVGTGAISDVFLTNMIHSYKNTEVVACCARHPEHAAAKAKKYGIRAATTEELLADPDIEVVVVLTGPDAHYDIIRRALLAGKHVYTEKTMTVTLSESAELIRLADERNLYLGSAPDTFLSPAFQAAKEAIAEGKIGEVTSFQINATRNMDVLTSLSPYLCQPGGGVCQDYGVYFLTVLVNMLGPIDRVMAVLQNPSVRRVNCLPGSPRFGEEYDYPNDSQADAIIGTESGVMGTFSINGESLIKDIGYFNIYGREGLIRLPNANEFTGHAVLVPQVKDYFSPVEEIVLPNKYSLPENARGIGISEMVDAIESGRDHRANKELAYHVLDVILAMERSSESGQFVHVESTCRMPELLSAELVAKLVSDEMCNIATTPI